MATVSFEPTTEAEPTAAAGAEPAPKQVPAVKEESQVANYRRTSTAEGEIGNEDLQTPRLNIVAKSGDLSTNFTPGNIVLNKTYEFKGALNVSALYIKKYYREVTDFDTPHTDKPRVFSTAAEVSAGGLRVGKPTSRMWEEEAAPQADILLFIEKPVDADEAASEAFGISLPSGKVGTLALFTATKTTYNTVAKSIFTALTMNKTVKELGLPGQFWKLDTTAEKFEKKSWHQGRIIPNGKLSAEDVAFLTELAGG